MQTNETDSLIEILDLCFLNQYTNESKFGKWLVPGAHNKLRALQLWSGIRNEMRRGLHSYEWSLTAVTYVFRKL